MLNNLKIDEENNIIIIPSTGVTFQINETAKKVIELLKEKKDKFEITEIISKEYNKNWKEVFIDIEDFILKLKLYGWIV